MPFLTIDNNIAIRHRMPVFFEKGMLCKKRTGDGGTDAANYRVPVVFAACNSSPFISISLTQQL
jgi:hypothetical protein